MNLAWIRDSLATYTPISFFPLAILAALVIAVAAGPRQRVGFVHAWALLTIVIFFAGFAASYGLAKRYYWPLVPVFLALVFQWLDWLSVPAAADRSAPPSGRQRLAWTLAALLLVVSCAPIGALRSKLHMPRDSIFEVTAAEMARDGIAGPIANNNFFSGLYLSYYLNLKYVGMPASGDPQAIVREMQALGVPTFISDTGGEPPSNFSQPAPDFSGCPQVTRVREYLGRSGAGTGGFVVYRVAPGPSP